MWRSEGDKFRVYMNSSADINCTYCVSFKIMSRGIHGKVLLFNLSSSCEGVGSPNVFLSMCVSQLGTHTSTEIHLQKQDSNLHSGIEILIFNRMEETPKYRMCLFILSTQFFHPKLTASTTSSTKTCKKIWFNKIALLLHVNKNQTMELKLLTNCVLCIKSD